MIPMPIAEIWGHTFEKQLATVPRLPWHDVTPSPSSPLEGHGLNGVSLGRLAYPAPGAKALDIELELL